MDFYRRFDFRFLLKDLPILSFGNRSVFTSADRCQRSFAVARATFKYLHWQHAHTEPADIAYTEDTADITDIGT